jgi:hypothetical protein
LLQFSHLLSVSQAFSPIFSAFLSLSTCHWLLARQQETASPSTLRPHLNLSHQWRLERLRLTPAQANPNPGMSGLASTPSNSPGAAASGQATRAPGRQRGSSPNPIAYGQSGSALYVSSILHDQKMDVGCQFLQRDFV